LVPTVKPNATDKKQCQQRKPKNRPNMHVPNTLKFKITLLIPKFGRSRQPNTQAAFSCRAAPIFSSVSLI
jgi:hypothetical protein